VSKIDFATLKTSGHSSCNREQASATAADSLLYRYVEELGFRTSDPCVSLRRASRAVTRFYDLVLAPCGLKSTQFITLQTIAERGEIAQWQLAEEYLFAVDTLSRRLGNLRANGFVTVRVGTAKRGERLYSVTPAGLAKLEQATPFFKRAQERLRTVMGDSDLQSITRGADQIAESARAAECAKMANTTGS
jgi:DNA-binding MarR family transcriptional regulator